MTVTNDDPLGAEDAEQNPEVRLGNEVRAWIARRRISQRRMAKHLGMTPSSLNARMLGKRSFNLTELLSIASVVDVTLGQLLGDELVNEKNPHLVSGEGSRGQNAGRVVAGDGFEPSTSGL